MGYDRFHCEAAPAVGAASRLTGFVEHAFFNQAAQVLVHSLARDVKAGGSPLGDIEGWLATFSRMKRRTASPCSRKRIDHCPDPS